MKKFYIIFLLVILATITRGQGSLFEYDNAGKLVKRLEASGLLVSTKVFLRGTMSGEYL